MSTSAKQDLQGVANGTSITTATAGPGDTAPSAIAGTTLVVDQTHQFRGGAMITFAQGAGVVMTETIPFASAQTKGAFGIGYDAPATLPASAWVFCQFQNGATITCRLNIAGTGVAGEVRLATSASVAIAVSGAGAAPVTTRRWIWVTFDLTASPQQLQMQVYDSTGAVQYDSGVVTNTTVGTTWDRVVIGNIANSPTVPSFRAGRILVDTTVFTKTLPDDITPQGAANITVSASVVAGATPNYAAGAAILAQASVAAAATTSGASGGAAAISVSAALAAAPTQTFQAAAAIQVAASVAAAPTLTRQAAAAISVSASVAAVFSRVDWFQDFDGTAGARAFDTNNGFNAPTVSPTAAHDGADGLIVAESTSAAQRALWVKGTTFPNGYGRWAFSVWFMLPSLPTSTDLAGSGANIVDARNDTLVGGTGQGHFQTFFRAAPNSDLAWDLLAANAGVSSMKILAGAWHYLQCKGRYDDPAGVYTADVQIDGIPQTSITSTGVSVQNLGSIGVGSEATTQTYTVYFDGFLCAAGPDVIGFLGTPPNVQNGAVAISVSAGVVAGATPNYAAGAAILAQASVSAAATTTQPAAVAISVSAGVVAGATPNYAAGAAILAQASVSAAATTSGAGQAAATITTTASLTAAPTLTAQSAVTITTGSSVSAAPSRSTFAAVSITVLAQLAAAAAQTELAGALITVSAQVGATAQIPTAVTPGSMKPGSAAGPSMRAATTTGPTMRPLATTGSTMRGG